MSTVFIVGAGASIDSGFPTGDQLRGLISESLNFEVEYDNRLTRGSRKIYEALELHARQIGKNINDYISAARHVAHAIRIAPSIDHLIEAHAENEELVLVSKLAIALAIKNCEASSKLVVDPGNIYNKMDFEFIDKETWYRELFNILFLDCKSADVGKVLSAVTFIVFNYDRCLEYVLFHMIKDFFRLDAEIAQELMLNANFYHPYGTLGSRGRTTPASHHLMGFASSPNGQSLLRSVESLQTFSEGTDENSSEIIQIRDALVNADQIVSLGFAYHEINLKLLTVSSNQGTVPFWGTAVAISPANLNTIKRDMSHFLNLIRIEALEDLHCDKFLNNFSGPIGRIHRNSL